MNDKIERLAKIINNCLIAMGCKNITTEGKAIAYDLITDEGYIHHSDAVNYVKICPDCGGYDQFGYMPLGCLTCQGRGLVLKGEKS